MRHLLSAGLPYINGIKHLGNLIGSMLPADVYARFLRQRGHEVLYVCGTDEHGAPAEIAAEAAGESVADYCTRLHDLQADIYRRFDISFDHFGRTSRAPNHALTQEIFLQLHAAGLVQPRAIRQVWSPDDGRFLADRYIIGTCPHCAYDKARGDQCENCTSLLDPTDLKDARSALSGSRNLEVKDREHLFLTLSALQGRLEEWVRAQEHWPALSRQIAWKWLNEGLQDRCITRDLRWGVPVPLDGFEHLVFYVWFDAPIGYIAATAEWAEARGTPDAWREWWREGGDGVRYTQFMGKDNLPFHTVMFPGMLLGADAGWKLPDQIKGFHWLDYYGGKFSTSLGRGVFTDAALELFPADQWRYALLANCPETSDATFTWESFQTAVNKDLADVLGNFVNRVLRFSASKFGDTVPAGGSPGPVEAQLQVDVAACVAEVEAAFEALEFRAALRALRRLWTLGNLYIDQRAPWSLIKQDRDEAALVIRTCMNLMLVIGAASAPVIPGLSRTILAAFGREDAADGPPQPFLGLDTIGPGAPFTPPPVLVAKIDDARVAELVARFGK